jgi:hypothetical protein
MSNITIIGQYRYWTDLLEPLRTVEYFEDLIPKLRAKKQGYGAWMAGRRIGEYREFAYQQSVQIHGSALSIDDGPVCNCGLIAELEVPEAPYDSHILFANPGHIDYSKGQIVTAFYIRHRNQDDQTWPFPLHFFCQICSALEPAEMTGDEALDAILLEDFRAAHGHATEIEDATE